ncbi:MAG: DNA gyrase subunit A [Planctomycetaceae bacterium]|nr:DNA gyrase subunit A [Planctomycetaceae bacterium]
MSSDDQIPPDVSKPTESGEKIVYDMMQNVSPRSIENEMKESYLTYAMSVIVSRALPDVRDGLKPSQRRILVAMNGLGISHTSSRVKCAKICGETMGNYHPHGQEVIYPTLVRMAQEWNQRSVLIDKQGNFGSIAGLPAAAMRYTEARLSSVADMMLEDMKSDTVDYIPTYDGTNTEPSVLPSKFPNLLVNGGNGIAVGMATSIPTHNVNEVCDATIAVLDTPEISPVDLMKFCPGPDFPTGGVICGRSGIRRGYLTGRGNIVVRARARVEEHGKRNRIVITEIPYQQTRDRVEEIIAARVNEGKILGISGMRNESDLKEPVRLVIELKREADPDVVLNQLYQFTPLQDSFSIIMLALVDGKPRVLTFKEMIEEFIRHRMTVIRRRTLFLLAKARRRKHTVEGLIIALANIDEVIKTIRTSSTTAEAKQRLMQIQCPSALISRALGDNGFAIFTDERGKSENYSLTPVQAEAILKMTLGQLVNLEQEKLGGEYNELIGEINEYLRILGDESIIRSMIRDDLNEVKRKHGDKRRTEISGEELSEIDYEDLIEEETMVVSISNSGYIKRTPATAFKAQRRGGKGLKGAKAEDEDPIQHLFIASTHSYLLFFTNKGRVYWEKVYNLPQLTREAKGRAIVNMLELSDGEAIAGCFPVRNFDEPDNYLVIATKNGLVKKTALAAYGRPRTGGIIAVNLREGDELIDVAVVGPGDELMMSTANGNAIRFRHTAARAMGRNSSGVKGIKLRAGDAVVGMVVAVPDLTLLTVCENGYGKRTPFGPNGEPEAEKPPVDGIEDGAVEGDEIPENVVEPETNEPEETEADSATDNEDEVKSSLSYRTKGRGGLGLKDIRTTARNGKVVSITRVSEEDEVMMITARGKLQRIRVSDIRVMGRNTQGVRLMSLDEGDTLVAVKRVPKTDAEIEAETAETESEVSTKSAEE